MELLLDKFILVLVIVSVNIQQLLDGGEYDLYIHKQWKSIRIRLEVNLNYLLLPVLRVDGWPSWVAQLVLDFRVVGWAQVWR